MQHFMDSVPDDADLIFGFKDEYYFLSNMSPCDPFTIDDVQYKSSENYYQAMKTTDEDEQYIISLLTSYKSKTYARTLSIRYDWDSVKLDVMRTALEHKFKTPKLKELLIATGDKVIVEGNTWGDKFWGVSAKDGHGENNLGILLMELRHKLKQQE